MGAAAAQRLGRRMDVSGCRAKARPTLILILALWAGVASAETVATVSSPGNVLSVSVTIDEEGRPGYTVTRGGREIVTQSRLGFLLTDAPKLERNFTGDGVETRSFDETWEQPWGERRYVRNHYNEMRVRLVEKTALKRALVVVFRAFDEGVGFRYEFPDQPQLREVNIGDELTEFTMADPGTAWWIPGGEWNRYEYLYQRTPLNAVAQAHTPLTIRTDAGLHIAIHEAALVDYSSMWLRRVDGTRLKAVLSPSSQGAKVRRIAPFSTPWRTLMIADSAGALYAASDLILNLNEPNALGDVSWFKPAKYVGIWWGMHLGVWSWASGPQHGATTANTRRYIDFAAQNGFRGVLVEGWNVGWDGDWFANGGTFSFTQPYPDFDLEGLAEYAKRKGVHLIGHHETSANIAHYEQQLEAGLDLYQRLGIDSVKTGYVADAGGVQALGDDGRIHFEWHDGQVMSRHHLKVVTEAAKRHIAVVAHGSELPMVCCACCTELSLRATRSLVRSETPPQPASSRAASASGLAARVIQEFIGSASCVGRSVIRGITLRNACSVGDVPEVAPHGR